jgi:DNA-binding FadR family transcriptional regulator
MIVDGELKDGDLLPHESSLLENFGVSRPTLREAVRVLEAEGLIELRRGSRTGARVTIPSPEVVARPAALQLQLGRATLADVYVARSAIEPTAARLLVLNSDADHGGLERALDEARACIDDSERFAAATARFHLRLVELSGNQTLALMAGMVHEIILRQSQSSVRARWAEAGASSGTAQGDRRATYRRAIRAYEKLIQLVREGEGDEAERFWSRYLEEATRVIDVLE